MSVSVEIPTPKKSKRREPAKVGFVLDAGLVYWLTYQTKAQNGEYRYRGEQECFGGYNQFDPSRIYSDVKHIMFQVVESRGFPVVTVSIPLEIIAGTGETASKEQKESEFKFVVDPINKVLGRMRTDVGNKGQDGENALVQEQLDKAGYPKAEGWTILDGHAEVLRHFTGFDDVKEAIYKAFMFYVGPYFA